MEVRSPILIRHKVSKPVRFSRRFEGLLLRGIAVGEMLDDNPNIRGHPGLDTDHRAPLVADLQGRALERPKREVQWFGDPDVVGAVYRELLSPCSLKLALQRHGVQSVPVKRDLQ